MLASKQVSAFRSQVLRAPGPLGRVQCSRRGLKVQAIGNFFNGLFGGKGGGKAALGGLDEKKRIALVESLLEAASEPKPDEEVISGLVGSDASSLTL